MSDNSARIEVLLDEAKDLRVDWGGQVRDVEKVLQATGRYGSEIRGIVPDVLAAVAALTYADAPEMRRLVGLL